MINNFLIIIIIIIISDLRKESQFMDADDYYYYLLHFLFVQWRLICTCIARTSYFQPPLEKERKRSLEVNLRSEYIIMGIFFMLYNVKM